jgi:hypothetical protein
MQRVLDTDATAPRLRERTARCLPLGAKELQTLARELVADLGVPTHESPTSSAAELAGCPRRGMAFDDPLPPSPEVLCM